MNIVVFGHGRVAECLRCFVASDGLFLADTDGLEICDEWQTRRWFNDRQLDLVLVGLTGTPEQSSRELLLNVQGLVNVINCAMGNAKRLVVFSYFASISFSVLRKLCEFCRQEYEVNFEARITPSGNALRDAAVLLIQDVLAKETIASGAQSEEQGGEVRDQVVPESAGAQQHGLSAEAVLEMPLQTTQSATPGDLCPERNAAASAAAPCSIHHNP